MINPEMWLSSEAKRDLRAGYSSLIDHKGLIKSYASLEEV
jgi:hypothetical protein